MNRLTEIKISECGHNQIYYKHPHLDVMTPIDLVDNFNKSSSLVNILYDILNRLAKYEDTGLEPEEILSCTELKDIDKKLEELIKYNDLEEQGLLIKLPCKVGDTIYVLEPNGTIKECKVYNITTNIYADSNKNNPYWKGFEIKDDLFGKTVFLTREEAEKALEGMK